MKSIPHDLKRALYWFIDSVSKGMLDNPAWDFDSEEFEEGDLNWNKYVETMTDPTIIKTAISIWMNNIQLDDAGYVQNEDYAAWRAYQCLRPHFDAGFSHDDIVPPFTEMELSEPQS